jgi:hypothetical protein
MKLGNSVGWYELSKGAEHNVWMKLKLYKKRFEFSEHSKKP